MLNETLAQMAIQKLSLGPTDNHLDLYHLILNLPVFLNGGVFDTSGRCGALVMILEYTW